MTRALIAAALLLSLTACGKGEEQSNAGGEILPGSASDAMLPLDTVRSQAPLAPRAEPSGKAKDTDATASDAADAASDAAEAPAEAPSAAASPAE